MTIRFLGLKSDRQAQFALDILRGMGQEVIALESEDSVPEADNYENTVMVGLFTTGDPKLLRRGHLSRLASHRVLGCSPPWTKNCHLVVAIRKEFDDKSRPKEMCREWIRVAESLPSKNLNKFAPWGSLPTSFQNFNLYKRWIAERLLLDSDELGVRFMKPVRDFSIKEIQIIRNGLKLKKNKRLTDRVIRLARRTPYQIDISVIIETGAKLIELTNERRLLIESGLSFELILECIWRALSKIEDRVLIVAPLCPAWKRDESGYTFCGVEPNSSGIFYDKMAPELNYFTSFLKGLGVGYELLAWVADIEWFSLIEEPLIASKQKQSKEEFTAIIGRQCQIIQEDLKRRRINGKTRPFLELSLESDYLAEANRQKLRYEELLATSSAARKYFENILRAKSNFYQKQLGLAVFPDNPHRKVKSALVRDVVSHLAPLALLKEINPDSNLMFFLKKELFTKLYEDVPYISWHNSR
ncbi:MAG: hypothetical protein HY506_02235 [Candidatus Yanofskybacteria bacterium]|nr:hypothetical protein [Candidatus Yanofskybacteria bacterium]